MYQLMKAAKSAVEQIDEKVKQLEEHLGSKGAKTFDEYCEMCGEIKGLLTARRFITDLTKNLESHDD